MTGSLRGLAVLPIVLVGACSQDPLEAYCDEIADVRSDLAAAALMSGDEEGAVLGPVLRVIEGLRAESPEDLRAEWDTFVFAWRDLVDVVEETGIDPTTFDPEARPPGLSEREFDEIVAVGRELGTPRVREAVRAISDHAAAVCETPFELEPPS